MVARAWHAPVVATGIEIEIGQSLRVSKRGHNTGPNLASRIGEVQEFALTRCVSWAKIPLDIIVAEARTNQRCARGSLLVLG